MAEKETKPKRMAPGLDDPYKHAPPKPDGDLWAILLKPEMEADKIRCDGWKEEVQNLLIFAGLFSGVVTTFVIQSYQFLQPNPNDIIISLLTQIANGPNNTSSPLSAASSTSMVTSFVQTPSSVRINVFWFISLILSLTTVLVGTIALQWLREHQSYPVFSPKETLAMLHMRTKALEAWYVPQIFATLPLLLQGALVLFLAGLIDFTLPLGMKLSVPIACIIGLILLFLAATTTLPAFQPLLLLPGYFSRERVPTPCAFKSPQSQVFRTFFGFFLHLLSFIWPTIYRSKPRFSDCYNIIPKDSSRRHLFPFIYTIWHQKTWAAIDAEWLSLRDAWHQGILDKDPNLYGSRLYSNKLFPLSDITQCLVNAATGPTSAKHTEEYLVAACYCFQEISASIWKSSPGVIGERRDRRNNYFEKIYLQHWSGACSVSRFFIHGGKYKYDALPKEKTGMDPKAYFQMHGTLFCMDQVCLFLDMLLEKRTSIAALRRYQLEIQSRVSRYLLMGNIKTLLPMLSIGPQSHISVFAIAHEDYQTGFMNLSDSADLLATIIETATFDSHKDDHLANTLYNSNQVMPMIMDMLAGEVAFYLRSVAGTRNLDTTHPEISNQQDLHDIGEKYSAMFHSAATHLNNEIASELSTSCLPFELSAMLLMRFFHFSPYHEFDIDTISRNKNNSFIQSLGVLLDAISRYKRQMPAQTNDAIKTRFLGYDLVGVRKADENVTTDFMLRFSDEWWTAFFLNCDYSGLRGIVTRPVVPSSTPLGIGSRPSASATDAACPPLHDNINMPMSSSGISLHVRSEDAADMAISSFPVSHSDTPHPLGPTSDAFGQAVEPLTGADAQAPISSSDSPPEPLLRSDIPPDNPTTTRDSIIDIRPPIMSS